MYTQRIAVPSLGFLYLPVPKAACTAIKVALASKLGLPGPTAENHACQDDEFWKDYLISVEAVETSPLFRWAVVRNPYDRLVATWANKVRQPVQDPRLYLPEIHGLPFEEFAWKVFHGELGGEAHVVPQVLFLYHRGRPLFDECWHWEHLGTVWENLQKRFPSLPPALPHLNVSGHPAYQTMYPPALRQAAEAYYQTDAEFFGYEF